MIVSVIIPAYNRITLLERAITSVRLQTLPDWEAIVVDDASTEPVGPAVTRLQDLRVRCVRRQQNGGVAAAQNTGLDHASGRYVTFLHSDDELLPDGLRRLSDVLDNSSLDIGAVECGHEECDESGRRSLHAPYLDGAGHRDLLTYRNGVHISKLLIRRELANEIRFDDLLRGAEDRDFAIRLLRSTRVAIENEPLVRIERTLDGLRAQPKGAIYEYLLDKYHDEIVLDPALHRSWWLRIARAHERSGNMSGARRAVRRAAGADPTRVRIWPLAAMSLLGDRVFDLSLRAYEKVASIAHY